MAVRKASVGSAKKGTRKKVARKATSKTKSASAKKAPAPSFSLKDGPMSKSDIIRALTDLDGLARKDVITILNGLGQLIEQHIKPRGPGKFVLPGLLKVVVVKKPATPARKGINPFTGEMATFKAKPARRVIKIRPLKKLKEMAL